MIKIFTILAFLVTSLVLTLSLTSTGTVYAHDYTPSEGGERCDEGHIFNPENPPPLLPGVGICQHENPDDSSGSEGEEGTASKPVLGLIPIPTGFPTEPNAIIASAVTVLIGIAGLIFFIVLLLGGLRYLTAGGDEKSTMAARQTLTNAFIGLIIVVASFLIAQILFAVFGLDALVNVI